MPRGGFSPNTLGAGTANYAVPVFLYIHVNPNNMKDKNIIKEKQRGRRFREAVDVKSRSLAIIKQYGEKSKSILLRS